MALIKRIVDADRYNFALNALQYGVDTNGLLEGEECERALREARRYSVLWEDDLDPSDPEHRAITVHLQLGERTWGAFWVFVDLFGYDAEAKGYTADYVPELIQKRRDWLKAKADRRRREDAAILSGWADFLADDTVARHSKRAFADRSGWSYSRVCEVLKGM